VAEEAHIGAEVAVPDAAGLADTAGVGGFDDDALALARAGGHDASELVAEHQRLTHDRFADPTVLVPVEVGSTEAHGGDTHELFAGADFGLGFLVDTDVFGAV